MKPTSIIFLIVSAFLIIGGILLCCVGTLKANSSDTPLYDYTKNEDGEIETEFVFSNEDVSRIKITVDEANVKIVCGADEDRVVVKNITSSGLLTSFDCAIQNHTLSIENQNLFSLTDLAQGELNFKGFRYALRYLMNKDEYEVLNKQITVYVSDAFDIKSFDIEVDKGTVEISNYENVSDYDIFVKEGNIKLSDVTTNSKIECYAEKGTVTLENVSSKTVDLKADNGNINATVDASEIKTLCGTGNITVKTQKNLDEYNYDLSSPLGSVTVNGNNRGGTYISTVATFTDFIKAECADGNIVVQAYIPSTVDQTN